MCSPTLEVGRLGMDADQMVGMFRWLGFSTTDEKIVGAQIRITHVSSRRNTVFAIITRLSFCNSGLTERIEALAALPTIAYPRHTGLCPIFIT